MKIHEYQGKELFRKFGMVTPRGFPCFSVDEAVEAAKKLGGSVWVVKAQIHAGGRGKGGGVKVAKSLDEVKKLAEQILGMQLVTHQTGPGGQKVRRLLIEEGADIKKELYVGMVVDRVTQRVALMASSEGGMDIEEVAAKTPEKIHKVFIDPGTGLLDADAADVAGKIGIPEASRPEAAKLLQGLYKCFDETDASLAEINPLILTGDGKVVALDSKLNFDDNALFRHPDIVAMRDLDEEDPLEIEASKYDLSYISLDGNIGCLVNGAGLAMATMDTIKLYGARTGQLPRRRRRRHRREGHRGVQDHALQPEGEVHPGQHLRRHHEVRHHRRRRGDRGARGEAVGAAGGAHEGHQRGPRQENPQGFGPADHLGRQHGRGGAEGRRRGEGAVAMSILIDKNTRVMTQGITGKTGQFHTKMGKDYANGKNCYVAGVNPKKAGERFEGIPIFGSVKEAKQQTGANVSVIYVPPPFAAAAIEEAVEADLDLVDLHHRGHPGARHDPHQVQDAGQEDAPGGPELPRRDHAGRDQDRHHAGPHPQEGPDRRGVALGHADL